METRSSASFIVEEGEEGEESKDELKFEFQKLEREVKY
jgi:hypothetical protein